MAKRLERVDGLIEKYSDLPLEAIFKEDLLRTGMAFSGKALRVAAQFKSKSYFIFSFDLVPLADMPKKEHLRAP